MIGTLLLSLVLAAAPGGGSDGRSWEEASRASARALALGPGRELSGPGAMTLGSLVEEHDLLLFAERVGTVESARLAQAIYDRSGEVGFTTLATDLGPLTAHEVERLMRSRSLERYLRYRMHLLTIPTYNTEAEVPLIYQVDQRRVDAANATRERGEEVDDVRPASPGIWGLDIEHIAAAPVAARFLRRHTAGEAELMDPVWTLYGARWLNPLLIGVGDGAVLEELRENFGRSDAEAAWRATRQLLDAYEIYQREDDEPAWAAERRASVMDENLRHYAARHPQVTRLLVKMDPQLLSHPLLERPFGARIRDWARERGLSVSSVVVDCVSGEVMHPWFGDARPCEPQLGLATESFSELADGGLTLIDLRALRTHPALSERPTEVQQLVASQDLLVLVADATPTRLLPGRSLVVWYGSGLAVLLLSLLASIAYTVWYLRRRAR